MELLNVTLKDFGKANNVSEFSCLTLCFDSRFSKMVTLLWDVGSLERVITPLLISAQQRKPHKLSFCSKFRSMDSTSKLAVLKTPQESFLPPASFSVAILTSFQSPQTTTRRKTHQQAWSSKPSAKVRSSTRILRSCPV